MRRWCCGVERARALPDSPLAAYERALAGGFVVDAAQRRADTGVRVAEAVHRRCPLGVYLWGRWGAAQDLADGQLLQQPDGAAATLITSCSGCIVASFN